ncbi:MAG: cytochrome P450 [Actinomycetota bacterium]|nr:cytochrome P450 [Actinomycetota bacterium]
MTATRELYWDPFDIELDSAPHDTWRIMRDQQPVYRNDAYDFWALSRHADVEHAHRDPATFSSARGTVLELMGSNMASTGQMIFMDPPEHTALRALVSRAFTPRRMAELEERIRQFCADLLDPVVGQPSFDYVQDFGAQLPSRVISTLVGVPPEDQEEQRRNIDQIFHIEPGTGMINDVSLEARIELYQYLLDLVDRRTAEPRDDLVSALCQAEITDDDDGGTRRLTREETAVFANLLFSAGTETVGRLLGNAAVVLADFADERAKLVAEPELIGNAVEELLRFEAPSPVQGRTTTSAIELHGVSIPAGSKVLLLTGSAGRDERTFADPDRFDVRRRMQHHVSFGYGIHFCVGAALARMEGRIALEETFKRFQTWDVDRDHVTRQHTSTVRGYSEVRVLV